jgi:hypothetical protein
MEESHFSSSSQQIKDVPHCHVLLKDLLLVWLALGPNDPERRREKCGEILRIRLCELELTCLTWVPLLTRCEEFLAGSHKILANRL